MQIIRETDYAIRCVHYLASQKDNIIMVDEISNQMKIPKPFLAKILQKLVKENIVKSFRGIKGGFQLSREASAINLLEVIESIQGPMFINRCAVDPKTCDLSSTCAIHPVWIEIQEQVKKILQSYSLDKSLLQ
jgi:Rrf2 family transcriptional regulator, iron-sulfur cluster assembly transcription factor